MNKSNQGADIACTLNDAEFRERRALARRMILPKITKYQRISNGLTLSFDASRETRIAVEKFIILEQGCCGFLTFCLGPQPVPPQHALELSVTGPADATEFIDMFIQFIEDEEAIADAHKAT